MHWKSVEHVGTPPILLYSYATGTSIELEDILFVL